jgi:hypothetical protein
MSEPKKTIQTVSIECTSASVVADIVSWQYPDTAKDLNALDCKSDARNFERLLRYFIDAFARHHDITPERFCEVVPEQEMRAKLRKAVDSYKPGAYCITTYASWFFRQAVMRYLPDPPKPPLVQKPFTTGQER